MDKQPRIRRFKPEDLLSVKSLVDRTIELSYRDCYSRAVISFFKEWHALEHIQQDASAGYTVVLERDGRIVATGTLVNGELRRMFVEPKFQNRGLGKRILQHLIRRAVSSRLKEVTLDASLPAKQFYESCGFIVTQARSDLIGRARLKYYKMAKSLR